MAKKKTKRASNPPPSKRAPKAKPLETKIVPIDSLLEDPDNANEHDESSIQAIADSLKEFGQRKNIVVDEHGVIKAGNGTWLAAKLLGWTEITIGPAPEDEDRATAYALADNKTAELSKRDKSKVGAALVALGKRNVDITKLGFGSSERKALIALATPAANTKIAGDEKDDTIPELSKTVITKRGDVWKLGDHLLICADSFKRGADACKAIGHPIDAVCTDPPFAIYGSSTGIGADIADDSMVRPFFENAMKLALEVTKPFAHVYVFCDWRSFAGIWEASRAARTGGAYGLWPKNVLVWDKNDGLGSMYANCHEFIAFFTKTPTPKAMKSSEKETGQRMVLDKNVLDYSRPTGDERQHNAAKPTQLIRRLIVNATEKGDRVADFFGGSGTTLIAAEREERASVVFDHEPKWCDVIIERWERISGQKAQRVQRKAVA